MNDPNIGRIVVDEHELQQRIRELGKEILWDIAVDGAGPQRIRSPSASPLKPPSSTRILERCDALARCTEHPDGLTRVYLSPQQRAANALVLEWMREAGMGARLDAVGNVVGRYEGAQPGLPCLMLGSHLDTVRDAGRTART